MKLTTQQAIYLAALLHDIGKFWQRASKADETLSTQTKNLATNICPVWDGRTTHKHALWTSEFFAAFEQIIPQRFEYGGKQRSLSDLSARHHRRETDQYELERIISYADKLSSGQDRRPDEEGMDTSEGDRQYPFKKIPLQNIFDNLYEAKPSAERSWYPLVPLAVDQTNLPVTAEKLYQDLQPEYSTLWEKFAEEVEQLPIDNFNAFATTLLLLLQKYTWCIPSSTIDQPDVSLFDHLKTTAAIATCLFNSIESHGELPQTFDGLKAEEKDRFVLMAGDFSGIQSFIYQITSKGAAKTLKGRSFYLQLILDVILTKVRGIFEVEDAHVLLSSGGRFHLLLPNDPEKITRAVELIDKINLEMRELYDGKLHLAVTTVSFAPWQLLDRAGYVELVKEAESQIEEEKNRRHARKLDNAFFEPQPLKGVTAADVCKVTGMDLSDDQKALPDWLDDEGEGAVSKTVAQQIKLGQELRNAAVMLKYKGRNANRDDEFSPFDQQVTYTFLSEDKIQDGTLEKLLAQPQLEEVLWFNDPARFLQVSKKESSFASEFLFYGAAWTPVRIYDKEQKQYLPVDRSADFSDIAFDGDRNNDLGIVRMDVDNLGSAFKEGFIYSDDNIRASISRISTLSSMMNWFFGGYLHHLISARFSMPRALVAFGDETDGETEVAILCNHIMPIYAGGDDLFILTRWDIAPVLAQQIYGDFRKCTNQKMTISGGIAVTPPKYPIHKGASEAGEAENAAKELGPVINGKPSKDAICYLEQPLAWDDFKLAAELVQQMVQLQEQMKNRSLTDFLRRVSGEFIVGKSALYGRWRWRAAYQLKRMGQAKSKKVEEELVQFGSSLLTGSVNGNPLSRTNHKELIDVIPTVARWVQNLTRKA